MESCFKLRGVHLDIYIYNIFTIYYKYIFIYITYIYTSNCICIWGIACAPVSSMQFCHRSCTGVKRPWDIWMVILRTIWQNSFMRESWLPSCIMVCPQSWSIHLSSLISQYSRPQVNGHRVHGSMIGVKGDWPYLRKASGTCGSCGFRIWKGSIGFSMF